MSAPSEGKRRVPTLQDFHSLGEGGAGGERPDSKGDGKSAMASGVGALRRPMLRSEL